MLIAQIQGIINIFFGLWALLSLRSFEAVTGEKVDKWLVKTIAWLFVLSGLELWRTSDRRDSALFGVGWAAIIGGADIYYGAVKKRISKIYLLDAALEALIILAWLISLKENCRRRPSSSVQKL